jgi:hypothetical protein
MDRLFSMILRLKNGGGTKVFEIILTIFFGLGIVNNISCSQSSSLNHEKEILDYSVSVTKTSLMGSDFGPIIKASAVAYNSTTDKLFIGFRASNPFYFNLAKYKISLDKFPKPLMVDELNMGKGDLDVIALSPDEVYLASGGKSQEVSILKSDSPYLTFQATSEISEIAFSHNNLMAVGADDGWISIMDVPNEKNLGTMKVFNKAVLSIAFDSQNHLWVGGMGGKIYEIDPFLKKIVRSIDVMTGKDKAFHFLKIKPCFHPRTNKIVFVPEKKIFLTTHGGDYCAQFSVRLWSMETGELVKTFEEIGTLVKDLIWVPKIQKIVLVDYDLNLWKISLDNFKVDESVSIPDRMILKGPVLEGISFRRGRINDLALIKGTSYLVLAVGSYFRGGPGVYFIDVAEEPFGIRSYWSLVRVKHKVHTEYFYNKKYIN